MKNNKRFPQKVAPATSSRIPKTMAIQKPFFLKIALFASFTSLSGWFMKSTANMGFMINATTSDAASVKMSMVGR
ncbi:hypothetical protein D3C87_1803590 [compost metagenome]